MGREAGLAIAGFIKQNVILKVLILDYNPLGVDSCKQILKGLRLNTKLITLNL
jgi:hypothetical protein